VASRRQHQNPCSERNLQANGVPAKRAVRIARHHSVRDPYVQRRLGSRGRHEDDNGPRVYCRHMFRSRSSDAYFSAANTAADNIERLEARLLATIPVTEVTAVEPAERFQKIEMRNVVFRYVDKWSDAVFQVGPIDFTLRAGELVFITGGNGSGKS